MLRVIIGGRMQGKHAYALTRYGVSAEMLLDLNAWISDCISNKEDPEAKVEAFLATHPDGIVITEEVGCGIVPMAEEERRFRDVVGAVQIRVCARAAEVVRVVCGIGTVIKG